MQAELVAVLGRIAAQAVIVSGRIGSVEHRELAMDVAAKVRGRARRGQEGILARVDLTTRTRAISGPRAGVQ